MKNNALKKKILILSKEVNDFAKIKEANLPCEMCERLKIENISLYEKVLDLTNIVHKFIN